MSHDEGTWFDRREENENTTRVIWSGEDGTQVIALSPSGVCLYEATFTSATPEPVITSALEAVRALAAPSPARTAQPSRRRGDPVTTAQASTSPPPGGPGNGRAPGTGEDSGAAVPSGALQAAHRAKLLEHYRSQALSLADRDLLGRMIGDIAGEYGWTLDRDSRGEVYLELPPELHHQFTWDLLRQYEEMRVQVSTLNGRPAYANAADARAELRDRLNRERLHVPGFDWHTIDGHAYRVTRGPRQAAARESTEPIL